MLYVRYNTDSDVYGWSDGRTYYLSVAGNRDLENPHCDNWIECPLFPHPPENMSFGTKQMDQWSADSAEEWDNAVAQHWDTEFHPAAGELYQCKSLEEFRDKGRALLEAGLKVPSRFFERIDSELEMISND